MPLPSGLQTVTVTFGPYLAPDGTPASGSVTFQPAQRITHTPSGAVFDGQVTVRLDADGAGTVTLPASDGADVTPQNVRYAVFWALSGLPSPAPARVLLPAATPTVDLDQLIPAADGPAVVSLPAVLSVAGLTGIASADDLLAALGVQSLIRAAVAAVPWKAGRYYLPISPGAAGAATLGNNTCRAVPALIGQATPIVRLGAEITAAGQAGSVLRLGVYADDGTGYPGALIVDAGTIPGDAVAVAELTVAATLPAGLVWFAAVVQNAPTTQPTVRTASNPALPIPVPIGPTLPGPSVTAVGYATAGLSGALPATFPAGGSNAGTVARPLVRTA